MKAATPIALDNSSKAYDKAAINENFRQLVNNVTAIEETLEGMDVVTSVNGQSGDVTVTTESIGAIAEPEEEGSDGQVLTTDGAGGRTWTTLEDKGVTIDLLWTNPSPTSDFAAQTVTLSKSCTFYLVAYLYKTSSTNARTVSIVVSGGQRYYGNVIAFGSNTPVKRYCSVSDGAATFSAGYEGTSHTDHDDCCVPYKIYGVTV